MNKRAIAALCLGLVGLAAEMQARVVINEILYHAPGDLDDLEYVELHNTGTTAADLSGWKLTKGIKFEFPPGTRLDAGGFLVICRNAVRFKEFYEAPTAGEFQQALSNKGERVELADAAGQPVDAVRYKDDPPWPQGADGESGSLERNEAALEDPVESVQEAAREALTLIMKDPKKLAELNSIQPIITGIDFHKVEAVFVLGPFKNKSGSPREDLDVVFKKAMVKHLMDLGIENSMIVTSGDVPPVVLERLEKGKAHGFYFTGTLVKLKEGWEEEKRFVVDASMSLACMKYPDQILAMTMQATAQASVLKVSYKKSIVPKLVR